MRKWAILAGVSLATACGDPAGVNPDAAALALTPTDTLITVGDRADLVLRILDAGGNAVRPLVGGPLPEWHVSEPGVAALGVVQAGNDSEGHRETGAIEGVGPGEALVTVTYGALTAEARVRVNPSSLALDVAAAYLVQSVQRLDGGVPLVAGRDAELRVFVVADRANFFRPPVVATMHADGAPVGSFTLSAPAGGVPAEVDEGRLGWHARIPGDLVRPGATLSVELDTAGIPAAAGSVVRWPADGAAPLDVREVPPFGLRIVPVRLVRHQTTGRIEPADAPAFARFTLDVYPLGEAAVDVAPVFSTDADLTTQDGWTQLVQEMYALRLADPAGRYHYGAVQIPSGSPTGGLSYGGGTRASAGPDTRPEVMAHEIGHTFFLPHAPCGITSYDRNYPYANGAIGHHGYDLRASRIVEPQTSDLMTYCQPRWISDHHYEKALAFRAEHDLDMAAAPIEPTLVVWGRVSDDRLVLEPAFEIDARPTRAPAHGQYRIQGLDRDGRVIFDLAFEPRALPGGEVAPFLFALPTDLADPARLATLRLTGPGRTVERERAEDRITVVRDARTGAITAFDRKRAVPSS